MPKRLRGFLTYRPRTIAAITKIFLAEIERILLTASGATRIADTPRAAGQRHGGIYFVHRFGSTLNHYAHLHAYATDGMFMRGAPDVGCDACSAFIPARTITEADMVAATERVRRCVIRWFRLDRLLVAAAATDMLARKNSGVSIDPSVRTTLIDRDVPRSGCKTVDG